MSASSGTYGLTIHQPWAWLIANGHKDIESRQWSTSYRGKLIIHAGKTLVKPDAAAFRAVGIPLPPDDELDLGAVVAVATLRNCRPLLDTFEDAQRCASRELDDAGLRKFFGGRSDPWSDEAFDETFAWELGPVHQIKPVPWRGERRLWPVPTELLTACRAAFHAFNPPKVTAA